MLANMSFSLLVAPTLTGQKAVSFSVGWDKNGLDQLLQSLLGPLYRCLAIFRVKTFKYARLCHTICLTRAILHLFAYIVVLLISSCFVCMYMFFFLSPISLFPFPLS
jgi:type IV secretory pathway VirB2 component (pilin)